MANEFELKKHPKLPSGKQVLVVILDGFAENKHKDEYNAVHSAHTPTVDKLKENAERCRYLKAHGKAVGLPSWDDMGNSEVGHNALGSGKVVSQGASLVDEALASGSLFDSDAFKHVSTAFESNTLHLIGLLSNGGVHSRYNQLVLLMQGAFERGAKKMRLHVLTDGRDVPEGSSVEFVGQLEKDLEVLRSKGCDAQIASGGGRMYVTMDRYEADWNIVERGWKAHVLGEAPDMFPSALEAITELKGRGGTASTDQYLPPFVITDAEGKPKGAVQDGDAVVLFNYRSDRMIEISKAFEYPDFSKFDRKRMPKDLKFVGMLQYDGDLKLPARYLVPPPNISKTSGEYIVKNGMSIFACSETQKFGHITFFWNGNRSGYFDEKKETYVEIPSDNCPFNEKPDMKAREITEAGIAAVKSGKYDLVRINYANPDMVGHTGDLAATVQSCETVDKCLAEMLEAIESVGGIYLVTADHGNADDMAQRNKKTGAPLTGPDGSVLALTSHTLAPVMVSVGGVGLMESVKMRKDLPDAGIANVTATFMNLMGYEAPEDYEETLIEC